MPPAASSCRCVRRVRRTPSSSRSTSRRSPRRSPIEWLAERNPRWEIARDAVSGWHTIVMSRALSGVEALPQRHRVPRPRPGALRHPRGRPALGDGRVRADDPHRARRRVADAHRDARAHVGRPRRVPRLRDARRLRGRPSRALARPLLARSRATTADAVDARGYAAALAGAARRDRRADAAAGGDRQPDRGAERRRVGWRDRGLRGRRGGARSWPSSPSTGHGPLLDADWHVGDGADGARARPFGHGVAGRHGAEWPFRIGGRAALRTRRRRHEGVPRRGRARARARRRGAAGGPRHAAAAGRARRGARHRGDAAGDRGGGRARRRPA